MEHEKKHHDSHHTSDHETNTDHDEAHVVHHRKSKKINKGVIAIVICLIVIVLVGALAWLYTGKLTSAKEKIFNKIPLPAAIVDKKLMPAKGVLERITLAKQLADVQSQGAEPSDDPAGGQQRLGPLRHRQRPLRAHARQAHDLQLRLLERG